MTMSFGIQRLAMCTAVLGLLWAGTGCGGPGSAHRGALADAAQEVAQDLSALDGLNLDSLAACQKRVATRFKDLNWLMADSSLTFSLEDGQLIGVWARVKRSLKGTPQKVDLLKEQGEVCRTQLEGLRDAIRTRAKVDGMGQAMDEGYFDTQARRELDACKAWTTAWDDTQRYIRLGMELEQSTLAKMDSLILAKRAEWAQQIAQGDA